jgi:hypothetical protein
MAKKDDNEFASKQREAPDETAVEEKLEKKRKAAAGPPVVEAKDVNTLGPTEEGEDVGQEELQERVDAEEEFGMRGIKVDPTPNEAYTVAGVTAGQPTPETDDELRAEARAVRKIDGPEPI